MCDDLRCKLQRALDDIVRSVTAAEYDEAVSRYDAAAEQLRQQGRRSSAD